MDDGARERPRDPLDTLDLGDDELAQLVDVLRFRAHDHVVGARHVLGLGDTGDVADLLGDLGGLADLGLDQD